MSEAEVRSEVATALRERARLYQQEDGTEGAIGGWGWRAIAEALRREAKRVEDKAQA